MHHKPSNRTTPRSRAHSWPLVVAGLATFAGLATPPSACAGEWQVNTFRNPSIGLEYREGALSFHGGYYTTVLRDPGSARSEASGFTRVGVTAWLGESWYGSVSHLRGLDGARERRDFAILEAGYQHRVGDVILVRLGVAVIPRAHGFATKVNPTPGLSVKVPL